MKYFLDSAKLAEIKYAYENWGIDFPISVEVNPHLDKAEDMIKDAIKLSTISENFVIKIPCTEQGLIATKKLEEEGIPINVTLVFTASQALQVGRLGATYCSPFIGWQESSGVDCSQLLFDIIAIYENYEIDTEVIVAAVRNAKQIVEAGIVGADIVTASFEVYKDSFYHPFTDRGLKIFQDAWDDTDLGSI